MSFFNWFPQYKFIEGSIGEYEEFYREYKNFEKAGVLLLEYLKKHVKKTSASVRWKYATGHSPKNSIIQEDALL